MINNVADTTLSGSIKLEMTNVYVKELNVKHKSLINKTNYDACLTNLTDIANEMYDNYHQACIDNVKVTGLVKLIISMHYAVDIWIEKSYSYSLRPGKSHFVFNEITNLLNELNNEYLHEE